MASLAAAAAVMAVTVILASSGFRAGDRPGDATVTAVLGSVPHPDGRQRAVIATVRNPGSVPILVGLSVHRSRLPGWLGAGMSVAVPRRTGRRRHLPGGQATLGVVGAADSAYWPIPAPAAGRRCRLVAVIGQSGGRLRVISLPVAPEPAGTAAANRGGMRPDPFPPLDRSGN
jgi:hypothetical protein